MYRVLIRKAAAGPDLASACNPDLCFDSLWFPFQLNMTFHLFIVALAGAGAAVIAMVRPGSAEAWCFHLYEKAVYL